MAQDVGTGTTVVFGTSGFSADVLSIDHEEITREPIDTSHMGTTGEMTSIPARLYDPAGFSMEIAFDPDVQPPITAAAETVTMTFPLPAGQATAANLSGTAFVTGWEFGVPFEERMTATVKVKWNGGTGPTFTASA